MAAAIAVFASARRNGNTGQFTDLIASRLGIRIIDLGEKRIAPYDYEHRYRDDDFEPLMAELLACDRIIFASPVYWYAVAPGMKVFLDRISDFLELPDLLDQGRRLRGKTGFVVCTSVYDEVPSPFIEAFKMTFDYLGMRYGGCAHANCRSGFAPGEHGGEVDAFVRLVAEEPATP
jgi:multimeric flavodoxin WrbA